MADDAVQLTHCNAIPAPSQYALTGTFYTAVGAGVGALVGLIAKKPAKGALIGGAVGLVGGLALVAIVRRDCP